MGAARPGTHSAASRLPRPGDSDLPRVAYLGPKSPVPRPTTGRGPLQLPLLVHSRAGAQARVGGGSLGPATAGPCARLLLSPPGPAEQLPALSLFPSPGAGAGARPHSLASPEGCGQALP